VGITIPFGPSWCKEVNIGDLIDIVVDLDVDVTFRRSGGDWNVSTSESVGYDHGWAPRESTSWSFTPWSSTSFSFGYHRSFFSTIVDSTFRSDISFNIDSSGSGSVSFGDPNPHGGWNFGIGRLIGVEQSGSCSRF
jgi:hypothetical protein